MAKSPPKNSTTKPIAKSATKRTPRAAKIYPPQPAGGGQTSINPPCCPDPATNGLPDGTLMVVVDGEWMPVHPGTEGQHLEVGAGGTLIWVD